MRQIKFRAWDKKENKWLLGYEYSDLGGFSMFGECMLFGEWTAVLKSRPLQELDTVILMQFTGLLDKNGKEIYEGDLIKLEQWQPQEPYEVLFDRGGFCFKERGKEDFAHDCKYLEKGEVIGNIYEN